MVYPLLHFFLEIKHFVSFLSFILPQKVQECRAHQTALGPRLSCPSRASSSTKGKAKVLKLQHMYLVHSCKVFKLKSKINMGLLHSLVITVKIRLKHPQYLLPKKILENKHFSLQSNHAIITEPQKSPGWKQPPKITWSNLWWEREPR